MKYIRQSDYRIESGLPFLDTTRTYDGKVAEQRPIT